METRDAPQRRASYALAATFVILAAGIVSAGRLYCRDHEKSYRAEVELQLGAIARLKVDELTEWRKEQLEDAALFLKNAPFYSLVRRYFERPDDADARRQIQSWMEKFLQSNDQYDRVYFIDDRGATRMSVPAGPSPVPPAVSRVIPETLRSSRVVFKDFYRDEHDRKVYLACMVPILDGTGGGRPLGAMILRIDPSVYLYPRLQYWPVPSRTAETLLVRRDGNDVLYLNELKFRKNAALNLRFSMERGDLPSVKAARGKEGIVEGRDYRGVPVLACVRAVRDSPWLLVARMDLAEVYAPLHESLRIIISLVGAILVGAGAVTGLLWRQQSVRFYKAQLKAAMALRESEVRFRELFNRMSSGVVVYEAVDNGGDFIFRDFNPAAEKIEKVSRKDILGKRVSEVFPGVKAFGIFEVFQRVWQTGKPEYCPENIYEDERNPGGWRENWVFKLPTGEIVAIYNDITERKRAEEALRQNEERYRTLFCEVLDGICLADAETGVIIDCNQALAALVGRERAELIGQSQAILHPPHGDQSARSHTFRQHLAGKDGQILETQVVTDTGIIREVEIKANRLNLQGRKIIQGVFRDVTERRRAEENEKDMERRFLHSQKLESLGVLAGGIAHDFNNLLTAILGNMDLAMDDLSPLSPARRRIEDAIIATKRAEALTRQMLAYSGKGRFIVNDMDMSELVEENAHLLKATLSKSTTLNLHLGRELPTISADAGQIQQVVMNLITNASESLGEQAGIVALSTGVTDCDGTYLSHSRLGEQPAPGRFIFLEVTDTGCGMDEDTKGHLFDPFFTTKFTGRGLGMSAVLGIVRGHNGAIMVESEVGKGTTIRVLFPVSKTAPAGRGPKRKAANGRIRGAGKPPLSGTVLVVDDEECVRAPCAAMVTHAGYRALTAANGDEAVALLRDHAGEIVCVILDLTMPGKDGVATFEALRAIKPDVKVILSSGYNEQEAIRRFSGQGLARFIKKPYEMATLLAELGRVVKV